MTPIDDPYGFHGIVQEWPRDPNRPSCRGYADLPLARPTRLLVASDPESIGSRDAVVAGTRSALARIAGHESECLGPGNLGCWATNDPAARNILLAVAGAAPPTPDIERLVDEWQARGLELLGMVKANAVPDQVLPRRMRALNALVWRSDPREVLPDLIDAVLLESEDRRIFISYAREDGSAMADRVFEGLARKRFNVFLDRFRLDPGSDFLERIQDEILDKSMVVVIETPKAIESDWVRKEVDIAIARRLGLVAVNTVGSAVIREIDEPARCRIDDDEQIADFLVEQHRMQLLDRREALRQSVYQALRHAGLAPGVISEVPSGFVVHRPGRHQTVAISARPADLHRFRVADELANGAEAYLVHPQPSLERRKRDLRWLSDVSKVVEVDEGRINDAAAVIAE
jgi:TIR domain